MFFSTLVFLWAWVTNFWRFGLKSNWKLLEQASEVLDYLSCPSIASTVQVFKTVSVPLFFLLPLSIKSYKGWAGWRLNTILVTDYSSERRIAVESPQLTEESLLWQEAVKAIETQLTDLAEDVGDVILLRSSFIRIHKRWGTR